ncbi:hypothetical protein PACTADRAFT_47854 [Pachysolen tannophilus NRRL Y-2460]|uniref:Aldehyde dehydrogenase domain-containing protein n=1 Tax=Pachysolen tannophilus NRRL Y-2460 TaxID=669874 RepID=A0A1E4U200_PACTA|nr:hypothetical protein PACTADRAFT_47854 [Pachysolen tannophilus NRRL Y-2460]
MSKEVEITLPNGTKYLQPTGLFINNEYVCGSKGNLIDSIDPATGQVICSVECAEELDVDKAVQAAKAAFYDVWKDSISPSERGDLLYKLYELTKANKDILAQIEAFDSGKPLETNAVFDIDECIGVLKYYAGWADKSHGEYIPINKDKWCLTKHEPFGVVGQIVPWNYPLGMAIWKIAPALAAGNTLVLKSAENTPLSILYFGKLILEAGFPPGVVNFISGFGPIAGSALATHQDVRKIAFTGSTHTGRIIQKLASDTLKAVTLECGGKSPLLVFKDCDLDQAVKWAAIGIFSNMGQICTSTSRIYIEEEIYQEFLNKYVIHVKQEYKQGLPFEHKDVVVGPQVSKLQRDKILEYIEIGKKEGAKLLLGGSKPLEDKYSQGWFVEPTIFSDVNNKMRIVREEIFGPVVVCGKFKTQEEAIKLANDTEYGLGAAVFTKDNSKAFKVADAIEAGMVWINSSNDSDFHVPFGGVKMSGHGRELGDYGLNTYTQAKAIHVNTGFLL